VKLKVGSETLMKYLITYTNNDNEKLYKFTIMILKNIELNNTYSLLTGAQSIITKSTIAGSFLRSQKLRSYTIII